MTTLKCKMCGGDLTFTEGAMTCECEYCGSTNTLPALDNREQRANLYNRANRLRMQCEFDKALAAYEKILDQDNTDAEAHWGVVLSRWGIEYVEDPATGDRIPTCHRVQMQSILTDADYLAALENAPYLSTKEAYEAEAHRIADIQKEILAISQQEKPYDVFICYKETDETGSRTKDSTLAQDIYYQLTNDGYKVFFSRITLEDKLGQQYEPYIFAALNSAKVMLVIGTKPEYFEAVWVKNEWSRYLHLMHSDRSRLLIPCYRDMDPYDLPEELSNLQSQDMSKIGFMQDLLRGVKKVLDTEKPEPVQQVVQQTVVNASSVGEIDPLYRRAMLFLEDGDFRSAKEYADRILDMNPEYAPAYMAKVLAHYECRNEKELEERRADKDIANKTDMQKAIRFASNPALYQRVVDTVAKSGRFIEIMNSINVPGGIINGVESITTAAERTLKQRVEQQGTKDATEQAYKDAAGALDALSNYPKASECAALCRQLAKIMPLLSKYNQLCEDETELKNTEDWVNLQELAADFEALGTFRDSKSKARSARSAAQQAKENALNTAVETITKARFIWVADKVKEQLDALDGQIDCQTAYALYEQKIAELKAAEEKAKLKRKLVSKIACAVIAASVVLVCLYAFLLKPMSAYHKAKELLTESKYSEAYQQFLLLKGYKDVDTLLATDQNLLAAAAAREARIASFKQVGQYVTYGAYEQDNNQQNGKEPIEWLVLDYDEATQEALLISHYGLDARQYHHTTPYPTWAKSDIRVWLNNEFLNNAFTVSEQTAIAETSLSTPTFFVNGGADTIDKVFLLSEMEAKEYFVNATARKVTSTKYAIAQGASQAYDATLDDAGYYLWWLRSCGGSSDCAEVLSSDGLLGFCIVTSDGPVVRPAITLDLNTYALLPVVPAAEIMTETVTAVPVQESETLITKTASAEGFAGPVAVTVTLDDDNLIHAITVGDDNFCETAGFGAKVLEDAFQSQFIGMTLPVSIEDIDAIAGATITTEAVIEALNSVVQ